jgi:hypothetical protein
MTLMPVSNIAVAALCSSSGGVRVNGPQWDIRPKRRAAVTHLPGRRKEPPQNLVSDRDRDGGAQGHHADIPSETGGRLKRDGADGSVIDMALHFRDQRA